MESIYDNVNYIIYKRSHVNFITSKNGSLCVCNKAIIKYKNMNNQNVYVAGFICTEYNTNKRFFTDPIMNCVNKPNESMLSWLNSN